MTLPLHCDEGWLRGGSDLAEREGNASGDLTTHCFDASIVVGIGTGADHATVIGGKGGVVDHVERIERATAVAHEKIRALTDADLSKPTPCSEYDVRALLNHVIVGLAMCTAAAAGSQAPMPEGDQFGADPAGVYAERRRALLSALRADGVFDRNWEMPFGSLPGTFMAGNVFVDHLTHAWDIATATRQDTTLPADLVADAMEFVTQMDAAIMRSPGVCGPAVTVPDSASTQDKFIAFMGRHP